MSKPILFVVSVVAVAAIGSTAYLALNRGDGHDHAAEAAAGAVYVCPMHPWIKADHPDKCTICGMSLVARTAAEAASAALPAGTIALSQSQITTIGVATTTVARQPLVRTLRVSGRVEDDVTRHRVLAARVPGRIEKLNINYTGQAVVKGEPVAIMYSAEMLTAQRTYVEHLGAGQAYPASEIAGVREKLLTLGLTNDDIADLEKNRTPSATVVVRSQVDGTVIDRFAYEGQYVAAGDRIVETGDFTKMWFMFDVYESDMALLQIGQMVDVNTDAIPGETLSEPIAFIDPNFNESTRSTKARVALNDVHFQVDDQHLYMPHRVVATGRVRLPAPLVIALPKSAILDSGTGPVAFVELGGGGYERRKLVLGRRGDDLVEVIDGVKAGEKVVTRAALLLDAQAQFQAPFAATGNP
jgi:Cu(I)/Ag(I) efflux system membrane fusion protein